jgi:peptide deformylase
MAILKVARIGNPVVRAEARRVSPAQVKSPDLKRLIDDMEATMHEYDGVGLAAPQVHVGLRLAVLEVPESEERSQAAVPFTVIVNPVVTPLLDTKVLAYEGCLSIPGLRGLVPRYEKVRLEALDRKGRPFVTIASGFLARVLQHECDHLDGRVYLDRMTGLESLSFMEEFERFVAGEPEDDSAA